MHEHWKPLHPVCSWSGYGPANCYNVLKCCVKVSVFTAWFYWDVAQQRVIVCYRCFGKTYRSYLHGQPSAWLPTNVRQHPSAERRTQPNSGRSLKSHVVDRASMHNLFQLKPARCTLRLSIFISTSLHVSGNYVPIIRRTYSPYATLVFSTLYGWLSDTKKLCT